MFGIGNFDFPLFSAPGAHEGAGQTGGSFPGSLLNQKIGNRHIRQSAVCFPGFSPQHAPPFI